MPGYLCRCYAQAGNEVFGLYDYIIRPDSVEKALVKAEGLPFQMAIEALEQLGIQASFLFGAPSWNYTLIGSLVASILWLKWNTLSFVPWKAYGVNYNAISNVKIDNQNLKLITAVVSSDEINIEYWPKPKKKPIVNLNYQHGGVEPSFQNMKKIATGSAIAPENDKTRASHMSTMLRKTPTGGTSSEQAHRMMSMSVPNLKKSQFQTTEQASRTPTQHVVSHARSKIGQPITAIEDDGKVYLMNTDAFFTKQTYTRRDPQKESSFDLFLARLETGAMVFTSDPFQGPNPKIFDASDETLRWLTAILEGPQGADCQLSAAFDSTNISSVELSTTLGNILSDTKFPERFVFNTEANEVAFAVKSFWPAVDKAKPDVFGTPAILCLSLVASTKNFDTAITGSQVSALAGIKSVSLGELLADLASFTLDKSPGSRNTIWLTSDSVSTTTIRLCFIPSKTLDDTLKKLVEKANKLIALFVPKGKITLENPQIIIKKMWTKQVSPPKASTDVILSATIEITSGTTTLKLQLGLIFGDISNSFILNFRDKQQKSDNDDGKTAAKDIFKFLCDVFDIPDTITTILDDLPGFDHVFVIRVEYTKPVTGAWSIQLDLQVVIASMAFICSITLSDEEPKFRFAGSLFPENRGSKIGKQNVFGYLPYLPENEPWDNMDFTPTSKAQEGSDVGRLDNLYQRTSNAELPEAPFSPQVLSLSFQYAYPEVRFGATVICLPPSSGQKLPLLSLKAATLDLAFDLKQRKVTNFELATEVALTSPKNQLEARLMGSVSFQDGSSGLLQQGIEYDDRSSTPDYVLVEKDGSEQLRLLNGSWVFSGSIFGLRGSFIYSLCDDDANLEMVQLLENVVLDLSIDYTYAGKEGKSFGIHGTLYLGPLALDCTYTHEGAGKWKFFASLATSGQGAKTTLIDIVQSICDPEISKQLPSCIQNIEIIPDKQAELTSLTIEHDPAGGWLMVYVRVRLTDGASIVLYQIQRKRGSVKQEEAPPVKRVVMLQLSSLPTLPEIPVVGKFSLPFTGLQFQFVSAGGKSEDGITEEEVTVLNKKCPEGFAKLNFKPPPKKADATQQEAAKIALPAGFHFLIINGEQTLMDYLFGRPSLGKGKAIALNENVNATSSGLTPLNKKLGPVTVSAIGLNFDMAKQELKILVDGSVLVGPLEMSISGFGLAFSFEGKSLRDFASITARIELAGLGLAFSKPPLTIGGYLEHTDNETEEKFEGGATLGFDPWLFQAAGYYSHQKKGSQFDSLVAYARLSGPIATIGYAEIRDVSGGFGYNASLRYPTMTDIMTFPFIADPPNNPNEAIKAMLGPGWMTNKEDSNWIAAGLTVLAFQVLTVRAVIVVEWDKSVKLGVFGLATAEFPKQLERKFAKIQLGVAATIDFDAGILKIDGQLTPASFVLDQSCHLTGGFAMYSWFGSANGNDQGDWVFTIGGYHVLFQSPSRYPNPPRLGISWSYDDNISITGQAYLAITPKSCMGGGRLHVTLTLGALYAYFDAYADFLINYQPFHYIADGGVSVGVKYTLDLWLVSIPISIELGADLHLEGNPMCGRVRVNFYVFAFSVDFGLQPSKPDPVSGDDFWLMVMRSSGGGQPDLIPQLLQNEDSGADHTDEDPKAHIIACTEGLISEGKGASKPGDKWTVRGAIFAFTVSYKFPLKKATVTTIGPDNKPESVPVPIDGKKMNMYAKPMELKRTIDTSETTIEIKYRPGSKTNEEDMRTTATWINVTALYSKLPLGLWDKYDEDKDPSSGKQDGDLLNGNEKGTVELVTGVKLLPPPTERSKDLIPAFNPEEAMKEIAKDRGWLEGKPSDAAWVPEPVDTPQYQRVKDAWGQHQDAAKEVVSFWEELSIFDWVPKEAPKKDDGGKAGTPVPKRLRSGMPTRLVKKLDFFLVESPVLSQA